MGEIKLGHVKAGDVVVIDQGKEGVFDPRDKITIKPESGPAQTDPSKVKEALKELGISSVPKGTRLNPLRSYIENMQNAEKWATEGNASAVETSIDLARYDAEEAGIKVDEKRIQQIEMTVYPKAYEAMLEDAKRFAGQGEVPSADSCIYLARSYAEKAGIKVDEARIKEIEESLKKKS